MGLFNVSLRSGWGSQSWNVGFVLKNYGTLPALNVGSTVEFFNDHTPRTQKTEPTSVQIFPIEEFSSIVQFDMGEPDRAAVHDETKKLRINVCIPYQGRTVAASSTPQRFPIRRAVSRLTSRRRIRPPETRIACGPRSSEDAITSRGCGQPTEVSQNS